MLVVTTSMWMVYRVHTNSSDLGPHLSFLIKPMPLNSGFQNWLIRSLSARDHSDRGPALARNCFPLSRRQSDPGLEAVLGVADYYDAGARALAQRPTVPGLFLHIAHQSSLGYFVYGQYVSDSDGSFLAAIYKLALVGPFFFLLLLILVRVG